MNSLFPQQKPPPVDPRATICIDCGDPNAGCIEAGQRKCVRHVSASFWPANRASASDVRTAQGGAE